MAGRRSSALGRRQMRYAVLIEKSTTGYSAHLPDLPGCVAAAKTLEEVQKLIREAVEMHIESMQEHGEPIPEPTTLVDSITVTA
jgi:predicted RNase H-like HicB family nuclease